ncbi:SH3 domain-containing protein [Ureibacillus xyleni]|uniref:SH3 domain-containing protein n=1 Tax=Ureibacillus xyleni TaxID=614648 RepID=A0A285TC56_9BACL|nr:SH3 domain-containing protein [Ureibacillus xyleni]SOC19575.1 SH3 domain-containing protein [Ureibacillus xyleni]
MRKVAFVLLLLVFGISFAFSEDTTKAAGSTEMYVNAKSDIILRAEPKQNAEQLGTIKNHSKVRVFSSSKGWSYIKSGKLEGYVYTAALTNKNPKATNGTVTGGLSPADGLILTYQPSILEDKKETFIVSKVGKYTELYNPKSPLYPDVPNFVYLEKNDEFVVGVAQSDFIFIDIPLPLKQGHYVKDYSGFDEVIDVLVESTTKTIKVKAGTFKNVVILRYPNGSREYLAKGIGIIKSTNKDGKVITELVSVKKSK